MNLRIKVYFINGFLIVILFMILLSLFYHFHGSLEAFPTDEQQDKVKIATGLLISILIIIEAILLFIRIRLIRRDS